MWSIPYGLEMSSINLFIEATTPEGYAIVWRQSDSASIDEAFEEALMQLKTLRSPYRLELWSKAHAETEKGYAPLAFRDRNSDKVLISNTLKMLAGL
jgi:hypothetical protein